MTPDSQVSALIDIGAAEGARLHENATNDLIPEAYAAAIRDCLAMALDLVPLVKDPATFRYLLAAIAFLSGHASFGRVLFQLDGLAGTCVTCGATVYPGGLHESGYV
jgi:hypothetical protein